jgi:hypothetical protein
MLIENARVAGKIHWMRRLNFLTSVLFVVGKMIQLYRRSIWGWNISEEYPLPLAITARGGAEEPF